VQNHTGGELEVDVARGGAETDRLCHPDGLAAPGPLGRRNAGIATSREAGRGAADARRGSGRARARARTRPEGDYSRHEYHHPAAGWGAVRSVASVLERAGEPLDGVRALFVMNHEDGGFDCPGCAWPDEPSGLRLNICENGVKHATWELAPAKADREFFAPTPSASWPGGAITTSRRGDGSPSR
jgi:hypothetical protein